MAFDVPFLSPALLLVFMSFHQDIGRVIEIINDVKKREKTIEIVVQYDDKLATSKGSGQKHHAYDGGLADHVVLVALMAHRLAKKLPDFLIFTCDIDDIIISSIFHDFDKLGKYDDPPDREFFTPLDIYSMLVDNGLSSNGIRDGILHSHGGFGGYKDEAYGMTAIIVHAADMIASHVIKNDDETRKAIASLLKEIDDAI